MRKIKTRSYAGKLSDSNGRDARGSKRERKLSKTWPKEKERKRVRKKSWRRQKPSSFSEKGPDVTVNMLNLEFQMSHVGRKMLS